MTLQERSYQTIELPKILELLAQEASTEPAKQLCRELRPVFSLKLCEKLQQETEDAARLIGLQGSPAFSGLRDISAALERAEKGGFLNPVELLGVGAMLRAARLTKNYREERRQTETSLDEYFTLLSGNKFLEEKIENAIISEEEISDHASSELYQIRRQIRTAASKVREVLNRITSSQTNQKILQDSIITQRNGRFVVPVKAEYRSSMPGMVHDTSASGATLFIEPAAVVELNNNIRILYGKEKAAARPKTLMDIATIGAKVLKKRGLLPELDESEEINACSIHVPTNVDGKTQDWLLMFKNETHNHPTEIEPFGGAATCIGGCIRDPLSGRAYVHQAMRISGTGDPRRELSTTLPGKLPQRKLAQISAAGNSSYGNQIGLATGHVAEIYHQGYIAKHLECGAVVAAAPGENVIRKRPQPGDVVILLGGRRF